MFFCPSKANPLNKKPNNYSCFDMVFGQIMGEKWTLPLIRQLMLGPKRFSDLEKELPGISSRTLTQRLQKLDQIGVLYKEVTSISPLRTDFKLTPMGQDLSEIINAITKFGQKYFPEESQAQPSKAN
jgi:DNA-binding HxlR family transcriptional regulator